MINPRIEHLFRTDSHHLFKWSSKGIILTKGYVTINLNQLEPYDVLDILEQMLDEEITPNQKMDIMEVKEFFQEKINEILK